MPEGEAAIISVFSRVWMICTELILIALIHVIFHSKDIFTRWMKH
jgi:hypothetical protein